MSLDGMVWYIYERQQKRRQGSFKMASYGVCVLAMLVWTSLKMVCVSVSLPSLPLSTSAQWIVDSNGSRIKLVCVNWASHLQPMLAEGLDKQSLHHISSSISSFGFNCVRFTWSTFMFTNSSLSSQTISHTFTSLNLSHSLSAIAQHNPDLLPLTLSQAYYHVVAALGLHGLMVVLDNQISRPGWCCSDTDGNGFWGDPEFDPSVWLLGLRIVASTFRRLPHVVAMSLRNELRGPNQNVADWYRYMQLGARAIHDENPDILILFSGLSYCQNLRFLYSKPLDEGFKNKIVYELHWYSFTNGDSYTKANVDEKCASVSSSMMNKSGYLATPSREFTGPLFISEFGVDVTGSRANDNLYLPCIFAFMAAGDFDWAYWALQGSYYLRNGQQDLDEKYGVMNHEWDAPRNVSLLRKLQALQKPLIQDMDPPSSSVEFHVLFHPATGLCVHKVGTNQLNLSTCDFESRWRMNMQGEIVLDGTYVAIAAQGEGLEAVLEVTGTEWSGSWNNSVSATHMQFFTQLNNATLCLDGSSPPNIVTKSCICFSRSQCASGEDPSGQWFKFVNISLPTATQNSL